MNILQQCRPRKHLTCNVNSRNSSLELKNAVSSNLLSLVWHLTQLSTWWDSETLRRWDTLGILSIGPIGVERPTHWQWHPSPEGDPKVHKREKAHWAQTFITFLTAGAMWLATLTSSCRDRTLELWAQTDPSSLRLLLPGCLITAKERHWETKGAYPHSLYITPLSLSHHPFHSPGLFHFYFSINVYKFMKDRRWENRRKYILFVFLRLAY